MQVQINALQSSDGTVWDPRSPVKIVRDHAVREPTFSISWPLPTMRQCPTAAY